MRWAFLAATLFALCSGALYFWGKPSAESKRVIASQAQDSNFAELMRMRTKAALINTAAVSFTIQKNPNAFSCLTSATVTDCESKRENKTLIDLYENNQGGKLSQLQEGFGIRANPEGTDLEACRGFALDQTTIGCPYRMEASWSPACTKGSCKNVSNLNFHVILLATGQPKPLWELNETVHPNIPLSAEATCIRGGGTYTGFGCKQPGEEAPRHVEREEPRAEPTENSNASTLKPPEPPNPQEAPAQQPELPLICPNYVFMGGDPSKPEETCAPVDNSGWETQVTRELNKCGPELFTFKCIARPMPNLNMQPTLNVMKKMAQPCDDGSGPFNGMYSGQWAQVSVEQPECGEKEKEDISVGGPPTIDGAQDEPVSRE